MEDKLPIATQRLILKYEKSNLRLQTQNLAFKQQIFDIKAKHQKAIIKYEKIISDLKTENDSKGFNFSLLNERIGVPEE